MKQAGIYSFVNLVNGKRYIGQAVDIDRRIKSHYLRLIRSVDDALKLQNAWNKYGYQNFVVETLISAEEEHTKEYLKSWLDYLEKDYIQYYDSHKNGYNCTDGGEGNLGYVHSDETKQKQRIKRLGKPLSNETKIKMSKSLKGLKRTESTKLKISLTKKKKVLLISPLNDNYEVFGVQEFCILKGLSPSHISSMLNGNRPHHKGWTGKYLET